MTGPELKEILFTRKGDLSEFARYCGLTRQKVGERFKAAKMNMETLKQYAAWKGIDEGQFIVFASGPVPEKKDSYSATEQATSVVNEDTLPYISNPKNDTHMMQVVMKLLEDHAEKTQAIINLSEAAKICNYTMAKLNGCTEREIMALLENRAPQGKEKVG